MQHPLEKITLETIPNTKNQRLLAASWYEDQAVQGEVSPDNRLFCKFMHNFLYGRAKLRSQDRNELPLDLAFRANPSIQLVEFQYFAVIYKNRPSSPTWDKVPNAPPAGTDPKAQLRVVWTREEKVVPYLSVEITRAEWAQVGKSIRARPYYTLSAFEREACEPVFRLIPKVRANFNGLEAAREESGT